MSQRYEVAGPERADLMLADGTVLVADIYRPQTEPGSVATFPALLMRLPYGRAIASAVVLAHPAWYASHGYVVVIQDVRGCGDSSGDFRPLVDDEADGAATLDWVASLPCCNGKIGLYGFSYQGGNQYLTLAGAKRRPDAMAPVMAPWSVRDDWVFEGGAFRRELMTVWFMQMAALKAAHGGDAAALAAIQSGDTALLQARPDLSDIGLWQDHDSALWDRISPARRLVGHDLGVPILHVGGWYDYMLTGTLAAHAAFRARNPATSHIIIGPWVHIPWNRAGGATDFGPAAEFSIDAALLAFFEHYLKGEGTPPPPRRLFDLGSRNWVETPGAPPNASAFFLGSSGLAATLLSDGTLSHEPGAAGCDRLIHDPTYPAPLVGGHVGTPQGFADRARIDDFTSAAVYTTEPFTEPMLLHGTISLDLHCTASQPEFDLSASLSLVSDSGVANVIVTGFWRGTANGHSPITIDMRAILMTVKPGERLRLSLQGSAAPAFDVAYGVSDKPLQRRAITLTFAHGGATPSKLNLPLAPVPPEI